MNICSNCARNISNGLHTVYAEPGGYKKVCSECLEEHKAKMEYDNASHLRDISDGVQRIVNFLETYNR